MKLNYKGENIVIAGGSCSIGLLLSALSIEEGLFPVITYRNEKSLDRIHFELEKYSGSYSTVFLDLENRNSFNDLAGSVEKIDYFVDLIHGDYESFVSLSDDKIVDSYFNTYISGRASLIKIISRKMIINRFGRLLYLSSTAAKSPNPGQGFYSSSKLACEALYRNLSIELSSKGISALSLRPGYADTGRGSDYIEKNREEILKKIPSKKILGNNEIAESILFFLSDSATGFNATELVMDCGLTSCK